MDDWVVSKGILFLSELLKVPEDVTYRPFFVVALPPSDHAAEGTTFTEPFVGDGAKRLVVGDENAVELGCSLEVHIIGGSLGEGFDGPNDIPIPSPKSVHEMAVNVGIGVQRKAASHSLATTSRSRAGLDIPPSRARTAPARRRLRRYRPGFPLDGRSSRRAQRGSALVPAKDTPYASAPGFVPAGEDKRC